jgi:hypothetical protein
MSASSEAGGAKQSQALSSCNWVEAWEALADPNPLIPYTHPRNFDRFWPTGLAVCGLTLHLMSEVESLTQPRRAGGMCTLQSSSSFSTKAP